MLRTYRPAILSIFAVLLLGAGHGVWTDRWVHSRELDRSLARLEGVPTDVGDWHGEDLPYEAEDMSRAGIQGCVYRKYTNSRTRDAVTILLVCGRGGPICVHTPDVCYTAAGFQQIGGTEKAVMGPAADFWNIHFTVPNSVVPRRLEIHYAWSRDGANWAAPDSPRFALARYPAVYKLYVVRDRPMQLREGDDTVKTFLAQFLLGLRAAMGAPS